MKCSKCGAEIQIGDTFCKGCGTVVNSRRKKSPGEKPTSDPEPGKRIDSIEEPGVLKGNAETEMGDKYTNIPGSVNEIPEVKVNPYEEPDNGFTRAPEYEDYPETQTPSGGYYSPDSQPAGQENDSEPKKKKWPLILGICIAVVILMVVVASLGMNSFTEDDAKALVKAELDADILGEYDEEFEFNNFTREEAKNSQKKMIEQWVDVKQEEEGFSDSLRDRTAEMWDKAFHKTNYSIEKADQQDDGSFTVRVISKPLDLYAGMDGMYYRTLNEKLAQEHPEYFEGNADDALYYDALWNSELDQIINNNLENPVYRPEEYNTVKVDQDKDGNWIADEEDISKIEQKLFYYGSRWDQLSQN